MSRSPTAHPENARIDRLLRALVGVADVHITTTNEGKLRVTVLRDGGAHEHQLVRNVLSGLKAGFGLQLAPEDVQVVLHLESWPHRALQPESAAADVVGTAPAAPPAPAHPVADAQAKSNGNGNGKAHHANGSVNGNGAANNGRGNGNGAHVNGNGTHVNGDSRLHAALSSATSFDRDPARMRIFVESAPSCGDDLAPELDSIDIERNGNMLRCRVTVRVKERRYSAIAEASENSGTEAELAARVTLDALRAGGLTTARLEGVTLTTIADRVYVVAAVRPAGATAPRASAAPVLKTLASAAATAVLRAQGPIGN